MAETRDPENGTSPRMACGFCRKRKLRCNRAVPKCDSCLRFGYSCEYKPPKIALKKEQKTSSQQSHVKRLEDRLGKVEQLLQEARSQQIHQEATLMLDLDVSSLDRSAFEPQPSSFEERIIQDLEQLYFVYIQPSISVIHQARYLNAVQFGVNGQPPIFLRHALCALSAYASSTYAHLSDDLYQSARKHLQDAEIRDQNFDKVTLAHAQTWIIIAVYELRNCFMHRCLMSISRAVRLVQLMRLHRVDGTNRVRDQSLNLLKSPGDWTQAEERRRLFWFTFLMDRYTGISMGWPTLIDTRDIRTLLPASDEAYDNSVEELSIFLADATKTSDRHHILSSFAAQIVGVDTCCNRMQSLSRLEASNEPDDWTGNMWAKITRIEALVSDIVHVPERLTLPTAKLDPGNVFLNMGHAATVISVYRVATFQAGKSPLNAELMQRGRERCMEAASNILRVMKLTSHWEVHIFHPCTAFCLYIAAMVFAEAWRSESNPEYKEALRFMVDSLNNFKKATRLSFNLLQDMDEEMPGLFAELNGERDEEPPMDIYRELIHLNSVTPEPSPLRKPLQCLLPRSLSSSQQGNRIESGDSIDTQSSGTGSLEDATSWTVDDPDIASVGRFL